MIISKKTRRELDKIARKYASLYDMGVDRKTVKPDLCKKYLLDNALEKAYKLGLLESKSNI